MITTFKGPDPATLAFYLTFYMTFNFLAIHYITQSRRLPAKMSGDAMGTTVSFALEKESTGHNTRATRTWRRNQKACVICHKRKVRLPSLAAILYLR
jgi:hypothetical protein